MSHRIAPEELRRLRNDIPVREVIYALQIPWKQDDALCRFRCPLCQGMDTSVHPTQNLGRCFSCGKNFNPIDLVCAKQDKGFHSAIQWLRSFCSCRKSPEFTPLLTRLRKNTQMT